MVLGTPNSRSPGHEEGTFDERIARGLLPSPEPVSLRPQDGHGLGGDAPRANGRANGPPDNHVPPPAPSVGRSRAFHPDASLVLVGLRGSGKRSLGFIAATALGRRFITEDYYFQTITGLSRQDYLKVHGSEEFHKQDVEASKKMLSEHKFKCVIDCGLGSLTSGLQDYLREYCLTNPVVYVVRDMGQIKALLNLGDRSAKLMENGDASHRKCSNFEFYNLEDTSTRPTLEHETSDRASPTYSFKLKDAQADLSQFVRFITGVVTDRPGVNSPFSLAVPVELRVYTHALLVTMSAFQNGLLDFATLESGGDVVEVCVDDWYPAAAKTLSKMVASARRALKVPIMLSANRAFSAVSHNSCYLTILAHGVRLGVEYLSVDLDLEDHEIASLIALKGHTRIIGTYADRSPSSSGWTDAKWVRMYERAVALGCDMVRLLHTPLSREENETLGWFVQEIKSKTCPQLPLIAYNLGFLGRTSQIMNPILTTVTHPMVPQSRQNNADPMQPQLSSKAAIDALFHSFVLDPLQFYIVGGNVSGSLSPVMHNAAYAFLGLHHSYTTKSINSWTDIEHLARDPAFGGCSIVQPWKVKVVTKVAALSPHAKAIGAVNTLIPLRDDPKGLLGSLQSQANGRNRAGRVREWFGDNTDFIGISVCLERSLSPRNVIQPKTAGLVIGAGGMARAAVYAMLQLGCQNVVVYNRTVANTEALATHFNEWVKSRAHIPNLSPSDQVRVLRSLQDPWPPDLMMPTMVVSCVTHELLDGNPGADFEMPVQWLQSPSGGVVVEMAYMTKETPLIQQIKQYRASTGLPWVVVDGIETLIEQAIAQFEIMTGRKAPKSCMAEAVHRNLQENVSYLVDGEEFFT